MFKNLLNVSEFTELMFKNLLNVSEFTELNVSEFTLLQIVAVGLVLPADALRDVVAEKNAREVCSGGEGRAVVPVPAPYVLRSADQSDAFRHRAQRMGGHSDVEAGVTLSAGTSGRMSQDHGLVRVQQHGGSVSIFRAVSSHWVASVYLDVVEDLQLVPWGHLHIVDVQHDSRARGDRVLDDPVPILRAVIRGVGPRDDTFRWVQRGPGLRRVTVLGPNGWSDVVPNLEKQTEQAQRFGDCYHVGHSCVIPLFFPVQPVCTFMP